MFAHNKHNSVLVVEIVEFVYIRAFEGVDRDIQPLYREKKRTVCTSATTNN